VFWTLSPERSVVVLAIAAVLDYFIGDPWNWPHPVHGMGWVIRNYSKWALRQFHSRLPRQLAGIVLGVGLIVGSGVLGWLCVETGRILHSLLGTLIEAVLLASCFAGRSLRVAAEDVLAPVIAGDLKLARQKLKRYVGRDTDNLSEPEILRALLETVTENAVDGVTAPLFYAIVGAFLPMGSAPLALAYKAASTLDSMVGYRDAPYTDLGWFSARIEDALTWPPCRLTVYTLGILSPKPRHLWTVCRRDAPKDPSPNAGWSECAYAVMLGVQVGGANTYRGQVKEKPLLGDPIYPITVSKIRDAFKLTRRVVLIWLGVTIFVLVLLFILMKLLS
jgi:adenosylcobinamide-phosphate synthase